MGSSCKGARTWSRSGSRPRASRSRSGPGKARPRTRRVATALLSDLVERGLDPEQGILFVIDGAKALRKAIRNVAGAALCPAQGAQRDRPPARARPAEREAAPAASLGARRPRPWARPAANARRRA